MSLRDTQVWMVAAITGAESDGGDAASVVTASLRMTAAERLQVYRSGYKLRLVDCLRDDYPVLAGALGEDAFHPLARAYIDRHPSRSPNLNRFGRFMSAFCREASTPFASELAALEWALVEVLHAETSPPLDVSALQASDLEAWAGVRFERSEALRLLRFDHPVNAFFQKRWVDEEDVAIPEPSPSAVAVYRKDERLWRMDLTPPMASILFPLCEGATFGEALGKLDEEITDPEALGAAAQNLMIWFREWVDGGFFASLSR